MDAIEYLIDKGYADNQGDVAVKAGLGPNLISRIKNGHVKAVSDDAVRALCSEFKDLNIEYFRGKSDFISRSDQLLQESKDMLDANPPHEPLQHSATPDYVQRLFDEAVRMSTRNELLERQCEKLIGELRDSKEKNETFLSELRKSKEFNDSLVTDLVISRKQNDALITELRETRKENAALTTKLEAAIEGIESMKNQVSMLVSSYSVVAQPSPTFVNDMPGSIVPVIKFPIANVVAGSHANYASVVPEGLIRGHQFVADEIVKKAVKEMNKTKSKKKK